MKLWAFLLSILLAGSAVAETEVDVEKLRTFGTENKTILYVFSSPSCPHCAAFHKDILPTLKKDVAETGLAQIKLVDVPGDPRAMRASSLARCMTDNQYEVYMAKVYENQQYWLSGKDPDEMLRGYATLSGLPQKSQKRCVSNKKLVNHIAQQAMGLSQLYRVEALPTVVVAKGSEDHSFVGADERIIPEIMKLLKP